MSQGFIEISGARENNLKNVDLRIPKGKITIFTGVSGSGKSSLVFETIAQESGRQLNETYPSFVRTFLPKYRQPEADALSGLSAAVVIDQKRLGGNARSTLGTITDINSLLRLLISRFGSPSIGYANQFSFNDPAGMCPACEGLGSTITLNLDAALDLNRSLREGAILLPGYGPDSYLWKQFTDSGFFDIDKKVGAYTPEERDKLLYAGPEKVKISYQGSEFGATYEGLVEKFLRQNVRGDKEQTKAGQKKLEQFTQRCQCPLCGGKRYNERALSSKILGRSIYDFTAMQLDELIETLKGYDEPAAAPVVAGIIARVRALIDIGLSYVTLTRETPTLSGGESQRVKMVKHLSSSLTDMLYIFDEPSIGLHPRDVHRLNELLLRLRDKGNTVLVVEHDPDVIQIADFVVDMGPRAGAQGGQVVYSGDYPGLRGADTLTAKSLAHTLPINPRPRTPGEFISSAPSRLHNLKNVSLRVPLGLFTVVTGVAGSGKSTLVNQVFARAFPDTVRIDQTAPHQSSRSNTATYTGVMDFIRKCFAEENGVHPGLFSHNSEGGCDTCKGTGAVTISLSFMDAMDTPCPTCGGKRFKDEVLRYRYKGLSVVDVMGMTVAEAVTFFEAKEMRKKLSSLVRVGLPYMTLGQPLSTLSGGECQRLKLARELLQKGTVYILDEPTTGLHLSDIGNILAIIDSLADRGNTVIVIEHNLEVIKSADWLIDLGPDGGNRGGEILYEGPPAGLAGCERSATARYLVMTN